MSLPFPDIRLNIYLVCDVEGALSGRWYVEFFPPVVVVVGGKLHCRDEAEKYARARKMIWRGGGGANIGRVVICHFCR